MQIISCRVLVFLSQLLCVLMARRRKEPEHPQKCVHLIIHWYYTIETRRVWIFYSLCNLTLHSAKIKARQKLIHIISHSVYVRVYAYRGINFCIPPANERRRYSVTPSLIGWAHTQTDHYIYKLSTCWRTTLRTHDSYCPRCTPHMLMTRAR